MAEKSKVENFPLYKMIPKILPEFTVTSSSGKIGGRAIAFFMATTLIAVIIGIVLVTTIRPGQSVSQCVPCDESFDVLLFAIAT